MFSPAIIRKLDILLWIFSIPLIFMMIAEFSEQLSADTLLYFETYYFILWFVFVIEFVLKVYYAKNKLNYFKDNWIDVFVVLTPAFGAFRVFRFLRFPALLLSDKLLGVFEKLGMNLMYYLVFVIVVVLAGADLVMHFEKVNPNSDIQNFNDAIWWSINALANASSGLYVTTNGSKVVATILITIGFAVFSILIASLASFFVKEYSRTNKDQDLLEGIKDQLGIDDLIRQLDRIEKKLDEKK